MLVSIVVCVVILCGMSCCGGGGPEVVGFLFGCSVIVGEGKRFVCSVKGLVRTAIDPEMGG